MFPDLTLMNIRRASGIPRVVMYVKVMVGFVGGSSIIHNYDLVIGIENKKAWSIDHLTSSGFR